MIEFSNYKLKTVITKDGKSSIHDIDDAMENVCWEVQKSLARTGKATCDDCNDRSCIAHYQKTAE